jgi:NSS family neurotransmitter:Na+ symporter
MIAYIPKMATMNFSGEGSAEMASEFNALLADPVQMVFWMVVACAIALFVCSLGLQNGVERITKVLMVALLLLILVLVARAVTLPGAGEGIKFYLAPDFGALFGDLEAFSDAVFAAMGQAFFTLSIGIGSMEIFGSYIGRDYSLAGEALRIAGLDTFVALAAGLIIFPACFAFGVSPDSGPGLVFITLPAVFEQMWGGHVWAVLFFVLMSFAAVSTIIAVFEGILSFWMDQWGLTRRRAVAINLVLIPVLSLPCALGFNIWEGINLPGIGNIQAIEDFLVSNNFLVIGSLIMVLFCTSKGGWGWEGFLAEANAGRGMKYPNWLRRWVRYGVPVLIILIFLMGWVPLIQSWIGI